MYRTLISIVALITFIVAVGWKAYITGKNEATQKLTALHTAEKLKIQEAVNAELLKSKQREKELATSLRRVSQEYNNEIQRVTAKHDNIVDSLRNRPSTRSDNVSDSTSTDVGCTGKGLARPDAEFLARYSADAAKLQAALNSCKERYNSVMNMINGQDNK